jgi:NAD(P)-dependent dehydrogenase (short-subunit alcohol dehydrogenase family)
MPLARRTILITGGTSGIGLGIAKAFSEIGDRVVATGATQADVECAGAVQDHAAIEFMQLDVRQIQAVEAIVAAVGELNVVVNCAGVLFRGTEHDPAVFADVVDINLNGTMRMCTAARHALRASSGCIVNVASMLSFFGGGLVPGYSASKGGVAQLTKSLAIAYAEDGIRVNAVAPGWIQTPMTESLWQNTARNEAILSRTPLGRWGTPEDVAGPVVFLASPAARFVTGSILPVDGGYLIA